MGTHLSSGDTLQDEVRIVQAQSEAVETDWEPRLAAEMINS